MKAGWIVASVVVVSYFVLALLPGFWPLVLRQFVFMVPLTVAAFGVSAIVRVAPKSAELRGWGLIGLSVAALWCSEAYFAAHQVFIAPGGPPSPSAYDWLNFIAAVFGLAAMSVAAGLNRLPRTTRFVFVTDVIASWSILYAAVYAFWMWLLATPQTTWQDGARWAAYSSLGVVMLAGIAWLASGARRPRDHGLLDLVAASLAILAAGMVVWPMWLTGKVGGGSSFVNALDSSIVLTGYALMMMAAITRLASADGEWRMTMGRSLDMGQMWLSSVLSAVVLAGSAILGYWAYRLPDGSGERGLYVAVASASIIALVVRTGLLTYETGALRDTSSTDPVTGALNHRAFQDECDARILASRRRGAPFSLVVLDLDGFSRVNTLMGHAGGDDALRAVVSALQSAAGRSAAVFRLAADEFAVVAPGVVGAQAMPFATRLLDAVAGMELSPGLSVTASAGVVACDPCDESKEELLRRADAAQVWAKYHGKGRAVAYDERIVRALGVEERLRLDEQRSFIGVARALAAAADARDARNYYHARNVASLAVLLAESRGLDPQHVRLVEIAAILHDVGRIAMPDPVMPAYRLGHNKSRADEEHAALGAQLVGSLGVEGLPSWVRAHHERWDGSGFPDGLVGEEIPLEARIIALADAYDGMTAGRRGGAASMSKSAALQEIDHGIGNRFDPDLAERFIEVVGRTASLGWSDEWPAA